MSSDRAETERDPFISPALERALFIKFWTWLVVVTFLAVPVITGIATLAVQSVQLLASKRIDDLVTQISDIEKSSISVISKISADQGKAEGAASVAVAKADESKAALEKLNNDIKNASTALPLIRDLQTLTTMITTKPEFIRAVSESTKLGTISKSFPEAGEFKIGDNVVTQVAEFPICTISKIDISRPVINAGASCELMQQGGIWKLTMGTVSFCRVTCFK